MMNWKGISPSNCNVRSFIRFLTIENNSRIKIHRAPALVPSLDCCPSEKSGSARYNINSWMKKSESCARAQR